MEETRERLDEYRSELTIRLISILGFERQCGSKDQSVTTTILRNLSREHQIYRISSENRLEKLKNETLNVVEQVHHNIETLNHSAHEATQGEELSAG